MKPKTVKQVSEMTGVSVRTLQYYDNIGLLHPSERTEARYRLYTEDELTTLQEILLFRELEFPLKEIKEILTSPEYDREKALAQQIKMLTLKKEQLNSLIRLAKNLQKKGTNNMDFTSFDKSKLEDYARQAKEQYGKTEAYKEYKTKHSGRTDTQEQLIASDLMDIFGEFGTLLSTGTASPASGEAQALVLKLQSFISDNYYQCTPEILAGLGQMYTGNPEFTANIDKAGGEGTAAFVSEAIAIFTKQQ